MRPIRQASTPSGPLRDKHGAPAIRIDYNRQRLLTVIFYVPTFKESS